MNHDAMREPERRPYFCGEHHNDHMDQIMPSCSSHGYHLRQLGVVVVVVVPVNGSPSNHRRLDISTGTQDTFIIPSQAMLHVVVHKMAACEHGGLTIG